MMYTHRTCGPHPRWTSRLAGVALAAFGLSTVPAAAQSPSPRDYSVITQVPRRELDQWLKEEVTKSGGDFAKQRYHFVIGFSTGHFGSDPVQAIAMRRLAFSALNNSLSAGDQVTPVAWEMDVWNVGKPIALTAEPGSRAAFVDAVPYAPMANSRGGHDTERALFSALGRAVPSGKSGSTIILFLTNSNQSQSPTGAAVQLFGANNPQLASAIARLGYRDPVRHSFTASTASRTVNIDATALFPRKLVSLAGGASADRFPTFPRESWQPAADRPTQAETLPNAAASGNTPTPSAGAATPPAVAAARPSGGESGSRSEEGGFPWPWLLVGLLALAAVAWLIFGKKGPPKEPPAAQPPGKGRLLPGKVSAVVGTAPRVSRAELKPLHVNSEWFLVRVEGGPPIVAEEPPKEAIRLAGLKLDERRRLTVQSEGDAVFQGATGVRTDVANPRQLQLLPGEHLVCRVASATRLAEPVRIELIYSEKA